MLFLGNTAWVQKKVLLRHKEDTTAILSASVSWDCLPSLSITPDYTTIYIIFLLLFSNAQPLNHAWVTTAQEISSSGPRYSHLSIHRQSFHVSCSEVPDFCWACLLVLTSIVLLSRSEAPNPCKESSVIQCPNSQRPVSPPHPSSHHGHRQKLPSTFLLLILVNLLPHHCPDCFFLLQAIYLLTFPE